MPEKIETITLTFEREVWQWVIDILQTASTDYENKSLNCKRDSDFYMERSNLCDDLIDCINTKLGE